jgi:hypothetical protein
MIQATFAADFSQFVSETKKADAGLEGLMGKSVRLSDEFVKTQSNADRFRGSLQSFDGVMASLGVNIGAEARALGELSTAAGKTASELGLVSTAGLAAGAAFAGWKIGRMVSDFFELDEAIGNATAKLLGWGDVAGQVAGANADVLAKASKAAGIEIKDMALALAINEEVAKTSAAALKARTVVTVDVVAQEKAAADAIHAANARMVKDLQAQIDAVKPFKEAMVELNSVGTGWLGTLDTIDGAVVQGIKYYLEAGVSLKSLADAYGLTDAQVKAVSSSMKAEADAANKLAAETEALAKAHADELLEMDKATKARKEATAELQKQTAAADAAKKAMRELGNSTQFDLSSESGRASVPEGIRTWLHDGYSLAQATQIDFLMRWGLPINANDPLFRNKGPRVPGFAGGVENFAGGMALVGEQGPELVNLPRGSDVIPMGAGKGGGIVYNFYLVDNTESLARKVSSMIMSGTRRSGKVGL